MVDRPLLNLAFVVADTRLAGAERQVLRHLRCLDPRRYHPVVVCLNDPGELAVKLQHTGTLVVSPSWPKGRGVAGSIAAFVRLVRLYKELKLDIVHVVSHEGTAPGVLAARVAGVPVILASWRRHAAVAGAWTRHAAARADRIVVPTAELAATARDVLRVPVDRLRLVPPVIDPSELFGKDRAPGFDEPVFRVGTLARLVDAKGIDDLLAAAIRLRDAGRDIRWFVCGTSDDPVPFLRRAQRAGVESIFTFLGERGDRGGLFMTWDCYVQPSREDGLPVALIEAMAAGVPAVACRNPSIDAALANSGARLVPPSDPAALADAVAATLDDTMAERERRRGDSRRVASALGRLETSVVALHDLYEEVVAEARARSR